MPVRKYRSAAEMPPVERCDPRSEDFLDRVAKHWARSSAFSQRIYPRGVFKFRSIEEAQQARDRVTQENIDRLRRERAAQTP
ncbi:MAG: hypothetical protein ACJ75H_17595 [Thermoanaerobaculia bacterium]